VDSLRRDALGCNGQKISTSPNIDLLCKEGISFKNHFSNANWTKPSMISMLTGEYTSNLGITNTGFPIYPREKEVYYNGKIKSLPEILRSTGYYTASIMNNVFLFLHDENLKRFKILSLEPSIRILKLNKYFLQSKSFKFKKHYLCPIYKQDLFYDKKLINLIIKYKPKIIIINIGGGVQEKLALYIKNNSSWKTSIFCTGAALSFFSDTSNFFKINFLIDKLYLGWLVRSLNNPIFFYQRVLKSMKLIHLVFKSKIKFIY
jgi:hypothetical protein